MGTLKLRTPAGRLPATDNEDRVAVRRFYNGWALFRPGLDYPLRVYGSSQRDMADEAAQRLNGRLAED